MRVAVLGASGMAGHMIATYLEGKGYDVVRFVNKHKVTSHDEVADFTLTMNEGFGRMAMRGPFDVIVNCIGVLLPDADKEPDATIFLNSLLPHQLVRLYPDSHIIHISTDCVFSGAHGPYNEDSLLDGQLLYDRSKALGEPCDLTHTLTFRQSIIGPELKDGSGLFHWFAKQTREVNGFRNQVWNGITTLELAKGIEAAIEQKLTGLYHLVAPYPVSKYDLLTLFARHFDPLMDVNEVDAKVSSNKQLINNRTDFKFEVGTYGQQLEELRKWMEERPQLYGQYAGLFSE